MQPFSLSGGRSWLGPSSNSPVWLPAVEATSDLWPMKGQLPSAWSLFHPQIVPEGTRPLKAHFLGDRWVPINEAGFRDQWGPTHLVPTPLLVLGPAFCACFQCG